MHVAQSGRETDSWSQQLLEALARGGAGGGAAHSTLQRVAKGLQPLLEARMMELVEAAYKRWRRAGAGGPRDVLGRPRHSAKISRVTATYQAWFSDTAGKLLEHARGRTGGRRLPLGRARRCGPTSACTHMRLGAVRTSVNLGRCRHSQPRAVPPQSTSGVATSVNLVRCHLSQPRAART